MLQISTVQPSTLELLRKLQKVEILQSTRLVGGTALALQLGHRFSIDLDFFGQVEGNTENIVMNLVSEGFNVISRGNSKNIHILNVNGVKTDIVNYKYYSWIDDAVEDDGIRLAGLRDIAAMKVAAIINRGSKKDFIDMYFLLKHFSIKEIMNLYLKKYPDGSAFIAHKSLSYFEDAEKQLMPQMLIPTNWNDVKKRVAAAVKEI